MFKRQFIYSSYEGCKVLNWLCKRGTICQCKENERGYFLCQKSYVKGKGLDLGAEPPRIKLCRVSPGGQSSFSTQLTKPNLSLLEFIFIFACSCSL